MYYYIVTYDDKSPILIGPYTDNTEVLRRQASLHGKSEVHELPTANKQRAARMIKAEMVYKGGLVRFKHGKT